MGWDDMVHLIAIDPSYISVIDVGDLKHGVHSWITSAVFAKDHLTHPPSVVECLCNLLRCLHDGVITRLNAEEGWWTHPFE